MPLISIIIPTLNSEQYINAALESLKSQNISDIESILIDGGSSDETLSIVRKYPFVSTYLVAGSGLYAALNEGVKLCSGKYVGFLNSDDLLNKNALSRVAEIIRQNRAVDIISGRAVLFEETGLGKEHVLDDYGSYAGKSMHLTNLMHGVPLINAHFFKRRVFDEIGGFDESLRLSADREFMIRSSQYGFNYHYLPEILYKYRRHDNSLTLNRHHSNALQIGLEHIEIADRLLALKPSGEEGRMSHEWRRASTVTAIAGALKNRQWKIAIDLFVKRWKENILWPAHCIRIALMKTVRRLIR